MEHFYLARQAILDKYDSIIAYELLYRDAAGENIIDNPRHATASLLVNVLNQAGLKNIVGDKQAFINVEDNFLRHDFIESIPPETFIFELTATDKITPHTIDRVKALSKKGYKFSLDIDSYKKTNFLKEIQKYLHYVKIDTTCFETEFLKAFLNEFRRTKLHFIAAKVEDRTTFKLYHKAGCDGFQGYYFSKPQIIKDKKIDGSHITLFRLCDTIQSGASISEIVLEFEKNPSITLQLLQFMNSGAFHFRSRIASVHQVITLLGRSTLVQWLMLLLYSKNFAKGTTTQNPLIILVKQRTEIMVNLIKLIHKDADVEEQSHAYFVGILSLMDTLMHVPLSEVLEEFNVEENIHQALFEKEGLLGELYAVALAIEEFDTILIDVFLERHAIDAKVFEDMMLEVFKSATILEQSMNS